MDLCSACNVDFYHNPEARTLFSQACDHRICEPCWRRLFQRGNAYSCPSCDVRLRAQDWSDLPREVKQLESETQIRRRICEIYCKTEQDFSCSNEFNDYLENREDIIHRLANPTSRKEAADTWQIVERYQSDNAAEIMQAKGTTQRKKAQRIQDIISQEGTFFSSVNAEWSERERVLSAASAVAAEELGGGAATTPQRHQHPFQVRYRDLLLLTDDGDGAGQCVAPEGASGQRGKPSSPRSPYGAPQPMVGGGWLSPMSPGYVQKDPIRHANGGGQVPGAERRKARHYFFADLAASWPPATKAVLAA